MDSPTSPARHILLTSVGLVVATTIAYANSFSGPFVFDDISSIVSNPTLQHLWPLTDVLDPPGAATVTGRPLLNLTLAVNHAISGVDVWSYHFVNLLIHLCAGLTLFGVLRRSFLRCSVGSLPLAGAIALLWLLHPLQTESVSYIIQRAESLVSLCYLLTLYFVIRTLESPGTRRWPLLAIVACAAGMASKEVMVSAPIICLLYDRIIFNNTWRTIWTNRRPLYLGLFTTWVLLAALGAMHGRGTTAGFDTGITPWTYALTQCRAIAHYLSLVLWPHPLVFDYGTAVDQSIGPVLVYVLLLLSLIVATGVLLWKHPRLGFIAVVFLAVLAPSSSVVPIATQTMAEHRMYLPLASVLTLLVLGLHAVAGRFAWRICVCWALGLGVLTFVRNQAYASELTLWRDTATKRPQNARAHISLGAALEQLAQSEQAVSSLQEAVRLAPGDAAAHNSLGASLVKLNRLEAADSHFAAAIRLDQKLVSPHFNHGAVLATLGQLDSAQVHLEQAISLDPLFTQARAMLADVHNALGKALMTVDSLPAAISHFQAAIRVDSTFAEARSNLVKAEDLLRRRGGK